MMNTQSRPRWARAYLMVPVALVVAGGVRPARAADHDLCQEIERDTKETVIVFEPPSSFTICRAGHVESDVVAGRPLYVEVLADPATLFRYGVHGLSGEPTADRTDPDSPDAAMPWPRACTIWRRPKRVSTSRARLRRGPRRAVFALSGG